VLALSPSPGGFTAPQLAEQVRRLSQQDDSQYGSRRAAYDLKKLRGKQIVCRIGRTARYETIPQGARAMAASSIPTAAEPKPPSTSTTKPFARACLGFSKNWGLLHERRQLFFTASPLSA
jgi:hypothetical protein